MRYRHAIFALALPVVGACSGDSSSKATTPQVATSVTTPVTNPLKATTTTTAGTTAASAGAVGIADFKFGPAEVHVPLGGSVVWTNNDSQQHTATASAGAFDAGAIQPGASATVQFTTVGSFTYICSFHPFMMGTVVVG
jgi:plastocyanin